MTGRTGNWDSRTAGCGPGTWCGWTRRDTTEIEEIISAFPAVQDVCVIGVPDDHWGEVGKALLVVDADTFCMEAFRQYLAQTLASIKIPRYIEEVDQFPLTGAGKKDMARIRELYG